MTTRFAADYAKRVSGCKKCKLQLAKEELRLAKITPNPFVQNEDGPPPDMKLYFHPVCLFESFYKARATTKVIEEEGDIENWDDVNDEDKEKISKLIEDLMTVRQGKVSAPKTSKAPRTPKTPKATKPKKIDDQDEEIIPKKTTKKEEKKKEKPADTKSEKVEEESPEESVFNSFYKFCKLSDVIGSVSKHNDKSQAVNMFITKDGYNGDVLTLLRLLLPGIDQRVYNMKEKQMLKCYSDSYDLNLDELTDDYKQSGDASLTIRQALEDKKLIEAKKSDWSIQKVDRWLDRLTKISTEQEKTSHIKFAVKRLSGIEIMYLMRLVKKDLRIGAGTKHILDGFHPSAYSAFQTCRDLKDIVQRCLDGKLSNTNIEVGIKLGTPVLPMLAEACRSVEQAMSRCPNGMFAEIKYDGERVQVHKNGDVFQFFSRSLKPVQDHKISSFHEVIPKAFTKGDDLILDAEVLLVSSAGKPLPFGTLGKYKKNKFIDASPCLFIFDILRYNDEDLTGRSIKERRAILEEHMAEVDNSIKLSNSFFIENGDKTKLHTMIWKAIDEGLEGLVLKDAGSKYEPGKRHWLKVKKDYLEQGKMADTADLLVLGAYFGTGNKGGLMSVFLMGVHDPNTNTYRTVTKCGNGPTDSELDKINKDLKQKMKRIDRIYENLPSWLRCSRQLVPDFIIEDPKETLVWEITGAEFSKSDSHTAEGISIRFPRLTKVRDDKDWKTATNLQELKKLFQASKVKSDVDTTKEDEVPLYAKDEEAIADVIEEISTMKRKIEDVDTPAKKTKVEEKEDETCPKGKPSCRYGKECYRKNPKHFEEEWHPPK